MTDEAAPDDLLTYEQLSQLLQVKPSVLRTWVHRNQIPHLRFGNRTVRFRASEIDAWIEARSVPATGGPPER